MEKKELEYQPIMPEPKAFAIDCAKLVGLIAVVGFAVYGALHAFGIVH